MRLSTSRKSCLWSEMAAFAPLAITALLLSGCLDKLERETTATRQEVERSTRQMSEMQTNTQVMNALDNLEHSAEKREVHFSNGRAGLVAFQSPPYWFDDRAGQYFGTPLPIRIAKTAKGMPNVVLVGSDKSVPDAVDGYPFIPATFYEKILSWVSNVLAQADAGAVLAVPEAKIVETRARLARLTLLATAIWGARDYDALHKMYLYSDDVKRKERRHDEIADVEITGTELVRRKARLLMEQLRRWGVERRVITDYENAFQERLGDSMAKILNE